MWEDRMEINLVRGDQFVDTKNRKFGLGSMI